MFNMFCLVALVQVFRTIVGSAETFLDTTQLGDSDRYERIPRQPGCFCLRSSLHNHMCREDFGTCTLNLASNLTFLDLYFILQYNQPMIVDVHLFHNAFHASYTDRRTSSTSADISYFRLWVLDCHIIALQTSTNCFKLIREPKNLRTIQYCSL